MCFVLYLGSNRERPVSAWVETARRFYVKAGDEDAERARGHLEKQRVYYLGSSSGCGCGFRREPDWVFAEEDPTQREEVERDQRDLVGYLRACLEDEEELELLGCWSGDEEAPPKKQRALTLEELASPEFYFEEGEKLLLKRA